MKLTIRSPEAAGAAIRDLRKSAGLSQQALAEKLDVQQPTISRLERGDGGVQMRLFFDALALFSAQVTLTARKRKAPPLGEIF